MKRVATNTNLEDISDFDEQQQRKLKKKILKYQFDTLGEN